MLLENPNRGLVHCFCGFRGETIFEMRSDDGNIFQLCMCMHKIMDFVVISYSMIYTCQIICRGIGDASSGIGRINISMLMQLRGGASLPFSACLCH